MRRFLNETEPSHAVTQRNSFSDVTAQNAYAESSIALPQGSLLQINMRKSCLIFRKSGTFVSVWNEMNRHDLVKIKGPGIIHSSPPKITQNENLVIERVGHAYDQNFANEN